jgi:DNA polymerase (family 10)
MSRRDVYDALGALAFGYGVLDDRRARTYASAQRALRGVKDDLGEALASGRLAEVKGVGPKVLGIVREVLAGEEPAALAEVRGKVPAGLFAIGRIRGLGPAKVRALWQALDITTPAELEYACKENRLLDLEGFGARSQAVICEGLALLRAREGLCRLDEAWAEAEAALASLRAHPDVVDAAMVGAARRGAEAVPGVELLVAGPEAAVREALGDAAPRVERRVHTCAADAFGFARAWHTADAGHRDALAARAGAAGLTLDAQGLRGPDGAVPVPDEAALYAALGLHLPPAAVREGERGLWPADAPAPRLLRRSDLLGALHNHTVASDGVDTAEGMRDAAAARGLRWLGISDHSVSAAYAHGLEPERLEGQAAMLRDLSGACDLLAGVESDILQDGALDYAPEVLGGLDFVVASVHTRYGHGRAAETARMVAAASNPFTDVIGHPTGRLVLGRPPNDFDVEALLDACAASGCAVELNASPQRLDLKEEHLRAAKARGVMVSIAADAHRAEGLDALTFGVVQARRAELGPDDVLNTKSVDALRDWLRARRARAGAAR